MLLTSLSLKHVLEVKSESESVNISEGPLLNEKLCLLKGDSYI